MRTPSTVRYSIAHVQDTRELPVPKECRIPFRWKAVALPPPGQGGLTLGWDYEVVSSEHARFRVTVALDDREVKRVEVKLAGSGRSLGELDIRYGVVCQPFELVVSAADAVQAMEEGISLHMLEGTTPLWLFAEKDPQGPGQVVLQPHMATFGITDPVHEFFHRFVSLASVQQFGWMEGAVLDGLFDLGEIHEEAHAIFEQHLDLFFEGSQVLLEDPRGRIADDTIPGIESTLMYAALAKSRPSHPTLQRAIDFWLTHRGANGALNMGSVTCEGSYTAAYPLATVAGVLDRPDLADLAITHLRARRDRLVHDGAVWLRHRADNTRTYRGWARGVAWYMLGLTRSLMALDAPDRRDDVDDLREECARVADWALSHQRDDGLWSCYIEEPDTGAETSGSAGIAAALALATKHGLLDPEPRDAARLAYESLLGWLTPDGMLTGVSQSNKAEGGEALQRGGYRTISQMGMGLMGQLTAALA